MPDMQTKYEYLTKFKIPIHTESNISHILWEDIAKKLNEREQELFRAYFGVQTMLRRQDGRSGMYLRDVECVLIRIFENKLSGNQLYWD